MPNTSFPGWTQKNSLASTTILRGIENLNNLGKIENSTGKVRPSASEWMKWTVSSNFKQHLTRSLKRALADLGISYSKI